MSQLAAGAVSRVFNHGYIVFNHVQLRSLYL